MKQNSVRAFGLLVIALFSLSSCKVLNGSSTGSAASTDANSPSITPAPPSNPSSDATLSTLSISGGTLSPSFSSGTTSYTATVPNATSSITITPGATNSNSTIQVRVNGGSYSSVTSGGTSGSLSLNVGTNTIEVLITAQDGTTHTYTITITRSSPGASTDATLASLSMASGGFLSSASVGFFEYLASFVSTSGITYTPTFDPAVTAYSSSVAYSVGTIVVTPAAADPGATIEVAINGGTPSAVSSGAASSALALSVGSNSITVVVTAADGVTTKTYTITVTQAGPPASSDATLGYLALSSGTLSPSFDPTVTTYTASTPGATTSITVTPTANDSNASIQVRVNGGSYSSVVSGAASGSLSLNIGSNTIDVMVTAQDGNTTNTYTTTVTRNSDTTAPTVGTAISLTAYPTTMAISWGAATDNVTSAASLQYKVVQDTSTTNINTVAKCEASTNLVMDWTTNITSATAVGLSSATSYAFAVLVRDAAGNVSLYTPASKSTLAADSTAPSATSYTITTSPSQNSVTLTWTAATDAGTPQSLIQYQVYQGDSLTDVSSVTTITNSLNLGDGLVTALTDWTNGQTTYTVSGLQPSTTYYFNVIAKDQSGNQVAYTNVSPTTTADTTPPTQGSGIVATPGVSFAYLSWGAATDLVTLPENLQYKVVMATSSSLIDSVSKVNAGAGTVVMAYSPAVTSTIAGGLTANTSYAFAVLVKDEAGNESIYTPATTTTLASDVSPPTVSGTISTTAHPASIDLSWSAATDDGTPSSLLLYRVFMSASGTGSIDTVNKALAATAVTDWTVGMTSATATDLTGNTSYAFAVVVKDGSGKMTLLGPVSANTLSDTTAPVAGASFTATPSVTSVALAWSAGSDNLTSSSKLQYKVVMDTVSTNIDSTTKANASTNIVLDWAANITSATAAELTANTAYFFSVLVKDEAGNLALYGPRAATTTNPSDTTVPTISTLTLTTSAGTDASGLPYVTVSWSKASDNVTASANLQYQLVSSNAENNLDSVSKSLSATVEKAWFTSSSSTISATASNLAAGTLYAFNVIVKDQAGNMAIYTAASETTDLSGVPGATTLTVLPSGETSSSLGLRSFNGQKAGFFFTRSGETQPYYYQYLAGKTGSGGSASYNHYLVKFTTSGVLQTGFGTNGWLNVKSLSGITSYKSTSSVYMWQVCGGKLYTLANSSSTSYGLYEVTLSATSASFSSSKATFSLPTGTNGYVPNTNLKEFTCMGTDLYITWVDNNAKPNVYKYNTVGNSGTQTGAFSSGTSYFAPFLDGSSNLWFYNANNSSPAFHELAVTSGNTTLAGSNTISSANFPKAAYPTPAPSDYGFFGGFQPPAPDTDTVMHAAYGYAVRVWSDTADNLLTNLKVGAVTPSVSYNSSIVKPLSYGTITDGHMCRAANKYLGYSYYKYYSTTYKHTGSYYGYSFFLANSDGSRSSFLNKGNEISFRNKTYGSSGSGSAKKYISLACDESSDSVVLSFRSSKNYTVLIFMPLDANLP